MILYCTADLELWLIARMSRGTDVSFKVAGESILYSKAFAAHSHENESLIVYAMICMPTRAD